MAIQRNIRGHECTAFGANKTLIEWAEHSKLLNRYNLDFDELFLALAAAHPDQRVTFSIKLMQQIWNSTPSLGPYPFLMTLSKLEHDRFFYENYRDHVRHSLKVFLLGCFIYEGVEPIRTAIDRDSTGGREIANDDRFMVAWAVCALYHDLGYLMENPQADVGGRAWKYTQDELNKVLETLVSRTNAMTGFHENYELSLISKLGIRAYRVGAHENIESHNEVNFWKLLAPAGHRTLLCKKSTASPIEVYYSYAMRHSTVTGERPGFRDHGISSALLMLKIWHCFVERLELLASSSDPDVDDFLPYIEKLHDEAKANRELVLAGTQAIALHNINRDIWDNAHALESGLDFSSYSICLTDAARAKASPLAFLLGLADSLQEWDRERFRAPKPSDSSLIDQDVFIRTASDKILLGVHSDLQYADPGDPSGRFSKAITAMKRYLSPTAIDELVEVDRDELARQRKKKA